MTIRRFLPALIGCVVVLAASSAFAQQGGNGNGPLGQILNTYQTATNGWINQLLGYAQELFLALAAIEFAWSGIVLALEQREMEGYIAAFLKKLMGVMFFYALLLNGPTWIPLVIQSFTQIGQTVGGTGGLTPDSILQYGINQLGQPVLNAAGNVMQGIDFWHFYVAFERLPWMLLLGAIAVVIILCYVAIAFAFVMMTVEGYIVISAGMFYLGFGGSRWTSSYTERFLGTAVTTGIRIMAFYLIIGLGDTLAQQVWIPASATVASAVKSQQWSTAASDAFTLTAGILIFTALSFRLPKIIGSIITGSPSMSGGDLAAGAATALGGFGAAASMLAGAGKAAGWVGEKGGSKAKSASEKSLGGAMKAGGSAGSLASGASHSLKEMGGSLVGSNAKSASHVSPPKSEGKGFFGGPKQPAPPSSSSSGSVARSPSMAPSVGNGSNARGGATLPKPSSNNGHSAGNSEDQSAPQHISDSSSMDLSGAVEVDPPNSMNDAGTSGEALGANAGIEVAPPNSMNDAGTSGEAPGANAGVEVAPPNTMNVAAPSGEAPAPSTESSPSLASRAGDAAWAAGKAGLQTVGAAGAAAGAVALGATSVAASAAQIQLKGVEWTGKGVGKAAEKLSQGLTFTTGALKGLADDGSQPISVEPPTEGSLRGD
jgi:type IV secretion system protein TrbL